MDKRIFLEKKFLCPLCKKYFSHAYPNPRIYSATEREFDYHVTKYTWRDGIDTDIRPHHYDILQCFNCSYTALRENFEKSSGSNILISENYNSIDSNSSRVLAELRNMIKFPVLNFQSTVALHLSAIWIILLEKDPLKINHNTLGRLYLRLAWLYREKSTLNDQKTGSKKKHESILPSILSRMTSSTQSLLEDTSDFRTELIKEYPELADNPDPGSLSIINTKIEELNSIIYLLHQSIIRKKHTSASSNGSGGSPEELSDHLSHISLFWKDLPTNEKSATEQAVNALDFSYRNEDSDLTVEQSMGLINLITKLLLRLGYTNRALTSVTHIYKTGYREKQILQQRLAKGRKDQSMSNIDIKKIAKKISTIEYTLQQAGHQRKEIIEIIYSKNKSKIESLINSDFKTLQDLEKALIDAGIDESVVLYLKEKSIISDKSKKKGWFKN